MTRYPKIWGACPPGLPLATPMGRALLVFRDNFVHSAIFYVYNFTNTCLSPKVVLAISPGLET